MKKLLIFSEEYLKITKGMFLVWTNQVCETAKTRHVDVLLNNEHWAVNELGESLRANARITVYKLPFDMPSTWLRRTLPWRHRVFVLRVITFVLGQTLDFAFSPLIVFFLFLLLRRLAPGAVFSHTGGWPAGALCRWIIYAAKVARVPKRILVIHSHPEKDKFALSSTALAPLRFARAWLIGKCATSIVAVSDSVKVALETEVFSRPVIRVYNGIDLSTPDPRSMLRTGPLDWHPSGLTVGFVGALYPMKGPHVLLDAFRMVDIPCELALLGPNPPLPDYLKLLHERARLCENNVSFIGYHDDVDGFLEKIDVLVVPSIAFESFGMVILEAMKHKKPVICSDFGGMKEVVENGVTGLVVSAGSASELTKAIVTLLADPSVRRQMGQAGYRRLSERFTSRIMAAQYDELVFDH
jgi:teichuronic acid biosynthesis glycosyltransferase TuaC